MEFAKESLKEKKLYKFGAINTKYLERASCIFKESKLYLPSPSQLNDPWEAKPQYCVGNLTDPSYRQKFINYHLKQMLQLQENETRKKDIENWLDNLPLEKAEELTRQAALAYHESLKRYRICSFSNNHTHLLMWAHYAVSHTGYCIEFDANNDLFGESMKVDYEVDYPRLDWIDENHDKNLRIATLVKSDVWKYEGEYRLVGYEPHDQDSLSIKEHFLDFPPGCITGVMFGLDMPLEHKELIANWLGARANTQVKFKQAKLNHNCYKLDFEDTAVYV
ncbi:MAG: DUF2971 domain-containing protein [Amphritea sp.]